MTGGNLPSCHERTHFHLQRPQARRPLPPRPTRRQPPVLEWRRATDGRSDSNDSGVPGLELDHNGNFKAFDFEAQVHSVFANVKSILEASGSSWEQLVDVTVFLVDMNRDFHTFNRLYAEYFKDNQPCRTTMEINRLPTPIAIELKCIATVE